MCQVSAEDYQQTRLTPSSNVTGDHRCRNCTEDPLSQFVEAGSVTSSSTVNQPQEKHTFAHIHTQHHVCSSFGIENSSFNSPFNVSLEK